MNEISFKVQGSTPEPYKVTFTKESDHTLKAFCTCAAGENRQYCKHRFKILDGSLEGIVSTNKHQVEIVKSWLINTNLEKAISNLKLLESQAEDLKKQISNLKKQVARIMMLD